MTVAYRSGTSANGGISSTTDTVTFAAVPFGSQSGDLVIAVIETSAASITMSSAPSGWTPLTDSPESGNSQTIFTYWKVLTTLDVFGSKSFVLSAGGRPCGVMDCFTGVDGTTPIDAQAMDHAGSSTSQTVPAVTTDVADAWVVNWWAARDGTGGAAAVTLPGTHTARTNVATGFSVGGINTSLQSATLTTPGAAGTYGPYTATYSPTATAGLVSVALRPAGSAPVADPSQFFALL